MKQTDLNCDMGEGMDTDAGIMPWISSANIACGFHAGNMDTMKATVALALQHQVAVGAHPGFKDKANFGRTEQQLTENALFDLVTEQVYLLQAVCREAGCPLHHVKPHGALYNMAARDMLMSAVIARAVLSVDENLVLYGLSGSFLITESAKLGLRTASEVFADRAYEPNGNLRNRKYPDALIINEKDCLQQVLQMIQEGTVLCIDGNTITLQADTICLHGDGIKAAAFAKIIHLTLKEYHIDIQTI